MQPATTASSHAPFDLTAAAAAEMRQDGFDLSPVLGATEQLAAIVAAPPAVPAGAEDLRALPWSSIDNDTSRDLDQIEWAAREGDSIRVRIGIADVAATVPKGTPIDQFAQRQAQTVYTAAHNFPMLPLELSTGLTSMNPGEDRAALVAEFVVGADGAVAGQRIFSAWVCNRAQLAYSRVGPWLEQPPSTPPLPGMDAVMAEQLRLQDEAAQRLRAARNRAGALDFRRGEATPVVADGRVVGLEQSVDNRAMQMIEDLMIAANETAAGALHAARRSSISRIVRSPERWQRIAELVRQRSTNLPAPVELPAEPDAAALNRFLAAERERDPDHYPDLALAIIKLMGAGEYVLTRGDDPYPPAHFALAAHDYSHSTAPNRRFADLVTQRLLHALERNEPAPYTDDELSAIATHCNERAAAARKVERAMLKRAQAVALSGSIGQRYRAVVTGAGPKGVFVRVLQPAVEGMLVRGGQGADVGDTLNVELVHTDPQRAFIDFARV